MRLPGCGLRDRGPSSANGSEASRWSQGPADDLARESVEHDGEIGEGSSELT